jgi:hypothetical protein
MGTRKQASMVKGLERRDDRPERERVLRDLEVLEGTADDVVGGLRGSGGCPELACGSNGNHNEVLAVTARASKEAKPEPRERLTDDLPVEARKAAAIRGGVLASWMGLAYRARTANTDTKALEDSGRMQNVDVQN